MGVIYSIVNKINNATYIGSAIGNGNSRWMRHKKDLKTNHHHNIHLQRAYNKYGKNSFDFMILKEVNNVNILVEEQKYLDDRKNNHPAKSNYNICWVAGNCSGREVSEITRKKISDGQFGKTIPSETREKISKTWGEKANKTYFLISPEGKMVGFNNIRKFSRENNLCFTSIRLLLKGEIYYSEGWVKDYSHSYSFINPEGIVHKNITNLTNFCKKHDLKMKGMSKLHCNNAKSYFGWTKNINN